MADSPSTPALPDELVTVAHMRTVSLPGGVHRVALPATFGASGRFIGGRA